MIIASIQPGIVAQPCCTISVKMLTRKPSNTVMTDSSCFSCLCNCAWTLPTLVPHASQATFCQISISYMCIDLGIIVDFKCSVKKNLFPKRQCYRLAHECILISHILSLVEFKGNFPIVTIVLSVCLFIIREKHTVMFLNSLFFFLDRQLILPGNKTGTLRQHSATTCIGK